MSYLQPRLKLLDLNLTLLLERLGGGNPYWPMWGGSSRKGYFFSGFRYTKGVGISLAEIDFRGLKSVIVVCDRT